MAKSEGRHYRYMRIEFFAQNGLITVIDLDAAGDSSAAAADAIQRLAPGEWIKRAIAVRMGVQEEYKDERDRAKKFLDESKEACKLAKSQGDPTDPAVLEHYSKHSKKSRILVPGMGAGQRLSPSEATGILGPIGGPQQYRIRHKENPRDTLLAGVDVVPDFSIGQSSMMTPQRAPKVRRSKARR
jgi:hypothetical protein